MRNIYEREFQGRLTVARDVAGDPEKLHEASKIEALRAVAKAIHYGGYNLGFALPAIDRHGNTKILSGANYKPYDGSLLRICAEQAAVFGAADSDDSFLGTGYLFAPEPKNIVGIRRPMNFMHLCDVCLPVLSAASPNMNLASFRTPPTEDLLAAILDPRTEALKELAASIVPGEVFTLQTLNDYHSFETEYPEMPLDVSADELAVGGLCTRFPVVHLPRPRQVTPDEVYNPPFAAAA